MTKLISLNCSINPDICERTRQEVCGYLTPTQATVRSAAAIQGAELLRNSVHLGEQVHEEILSNLDAVMSGKPTGAVVARNAPSLGHQCVQVFRN